MSWNAKPSGGYGISSDAAVANYKEVVNLLSDTWTMEAICGLLGNMYAESGMNPWRWQSDKVSLSSSSKGYGLVQFTPAYGYINNYGVGVDYYAPNLSTSEVTAGAYATDGRAQIYVIDHDLAGKFINRSSWCSFLDISGYYPMSNYRQADSLYGATVAWLFHYEAPADHSQSVANTRYSYASQIYEILTGYEPEDPDDTSGDSSNDDEDEDEDESGGSGGGTSGGTSSSDLKEDDSDRLLLKITPFYTETDKETQVRYYIRTFRAWESSLRTLLNDLDYEDFSITGYAAEFYVWVEIEGTNASWFDVDVEFEMEYYEGDEEEREVATGYVTITVPKQAKGGEIYKITATFDMCSVDIDVIWHEDDYDDEGSVNVDLEGYYSVAYLKVLGDDKTKKRSSVFYRRPNYRIIG